MCASINRNRFEILAVEQPELADFPQLPTELLLDIIDLLDDRGDRGALVSVNRRTYSDLNGALYRRDAKSGEDAALHWAVKDGCLWTAELALAAGGDVNAVTPRCFYTLEQIVMLPPILRHTPQHKHSLVQIAVCRQEREIAKLLIHHGADIMKKMHAWQERLSLLHIASGLALVDIMELLLDKGAKVQARDAYDQTPLHHAVRPKLYRRSSGKAEAVALLLDRGASITTPNDAGHTPMDLFFSRERLMSAHNHMVISKTVPYPAPTFDPDIAKLLRNKELVLKVQKLDRDRAKKIKKDEKKREATRNQARKTRKGGK